MSSGIELLLASICFNATFCEYYQDNATSSEQLSRKHAELLELKKELNGKHLKIGTYNSYPLCWTEQKYDGSLTGHGIAFDIVDILRKQYNFTFDVVLPKKDFEYGGDEPEDSLVGLVNGSFVDFGAAFVPILYDYQSLVKFSSVLDEGVWAMMLKRPKESAAGSGLLAPFEYNVWYLILVAVLSYGPCITFLTRMRTKLVKDSEKPITLSPSFWFVYGAFIKQGTTLAPDANTTRVLFATWWIFIILLSAFYTANLTAFLTLSKFTLDVEYPQDLYKKNFRWIAQQGGPIQFVVEDENEDLHYLSSMITKGRAEFRSITNFSDYLPLVNGGAVLVKEQTIVDHLMFDDYGRKASEGVEESDRCTYVIAPHPFMKKLRGFIYPKNSTLYILFDRVLTDIVQGGIIKHLIRRDLPSTKICPLDLQSKDRRLQNSDLLMTYIIMVTGLAAAAAAFIVELLLKRSIHTKINDISQKPRRKKKRINFKLDSHDERVPPPTYDSLFGRNSLYKQSEEREIKVINGREYWEVKTMSGDKRLIPVRTPSAFLWNH